MTSGDPLETLRGRIDLRHVPFTDHLSRLLLFAADDGLWLAHASYERPIADSIALRRLRFTEGGADLTMLCSARPDRVDVHTPAGAFTIAFADAETLAIGGPPGNVGIAFALAADQIATTSGGGHAPIGAVASWLEWSGESRVEREAHVPDEATVHLAPGPDGGHRWLLRLTAGRDEPAPLFAAGDVLAAAERRWRDWLARAPEVTDALRPMAHYAWWVLRANQILPRFDPRRAGVVPSKIGYVGVWNWDACFHALGLRHGDTAAAKDQLRVILAHQLPDGMLPDVVHDNGVLASTLDLPPAERGFGLPPEWDPATPIPLTKPPLLAWAARAIWAQDGDTAFLREVYPPIARTLAWWFRAADSDSAGLASFDHAFSSGLDDSPLWDGGPPVLAPELNAYLVLQCDEMAVIASAIGRQADVGDWRQRADAIARRLVARLWDDRAGLFTSTRHGAPIPVATPFGAMPLLTGRLPDPIARRLVATLTDPDRFWPRYPVPTVALDDPAFTPHRMWRGPTWLNVNRLLVEGLLRSGFTVEAAALRQRTLALALANPDFREYYDPLTGAPPPRAAPMFSWAAASFLDLAVAETEDSRTRAMPRVEIGL